MKITVFVHNYVIKQEESLWISVKRFRSFVDKNVSLYIINTSKKYQRVIFTWSRNNYVNPSPLAQLQLRNLARTVSGFGEFMSSNIEIYVKQYRRSCVTKKYLPYIINTSSKKPYLEVGIANANSSLHPQLLNWASALSEFDCILQGDFF